MLFSVSWIKAKDIKTAKGNVESLQVMVKAKKFKQIRTELGVLGGYC